TRFQHALARRMTAMQLSVMEAFVNLKDARPELNTELWATPVPVYFATPFGELTASLTIYDAIYHDQLPCSPTAFQHSVHNCAPGYLAMVKAMRHPSMTVSSGYLSFDKALYLASQKIRSGLVPAAVVVNGH